MIFKPWNKDIEQMFLRISRNGKAYISDNFENTTRLIGRHPELKDYVEIYWNNEKRKSVVLPMDDVFVVPKPVSRRSKTRQFEIYRLF
jgi:hypothetical protein